MISFCSSDSAARQQALRLSCIDLCSPYRLKVSYRFSRANRFCTFWRICHRKIWPAQSFAFQLLNQIIRARVSVFVCFSASKFPLRCCFWFSAVQDLCLSSFSQVTTQPFRTQTLLLAPVFWWDLHIIVCIIEFDLPVPSHTFWVLRIVCSLSIALGLWVPQVQL